MKRIGFILLALSCSWFSHGDHVAEKARAVKEVLDCTQRIYEMAINTNKTFSLEEAKCHVRNIIEPLKTADQLVSLVLISESISFPQEAGYERFDQWFDSAFQIGLASLTNFPTNEAQSAFRTLEDRLFMDAGLSLSFDYLKGLVGMERKTVYIDDDFFKKKESLGESNSASNKDGIKTSKTTDNELSNDDKKVESGSNPEIENKQ